MPSTAQIDPKTGERVQAGGAPQIDPATGERTQSPAAPDITANPKGEGVYKMVGPNGPIGVPFSNVFKAQQTGYKLDPADHARYTKDYVGAPVPASAHEPEGTFGGVVSGAGSELKGIGKGIAGLFAPPQGTTEQTADAAGPGGLVALRVGRGVVANEKKAGGQTAQYGRETAAIPWSSPKEKLLSAARTGVSALSMANPIAPGGVADINQAEDEGHPDKALGMGLVDAGAMAVPDVAAAGLRKLAPTLAESALNVRGTDRAYGRTPGQAILDETSGYTPAKIAEQASSKVGDLSTDLEKVARESPNPASLLPAREAATDSIQAAINRNNPTTIKKMVNMGKQLGEDYSGAEIPETVSPDRLLHLKRGVGDLQTSWNPATSTPWVNGQVGNVYHALDSEFDRAVPEGADLNQRISSLMPVAQRATAADLNAGFMQRTIGRFKAHTGALAAGGFGADMGYRAGGVPGAVLGGAAGLLGTEVLAAPETWIGAARAANSPFVQEALPAVGKAAPTIKRVKDNDD